LIPLVRWPALRAEVCTLTQTPQDGAARVKERQTELEALLRRFDEELPRHPSLRIEDGSLVVGPLHADDKPPSLVALEALIDARLPLVELPDLLMEVDGWTGFSRHLEHAGGAEPRAPEMLVHCHASILAQACSFGLTRMAQLAGACPTANSLGAPPGICARKRSTPPSTGSTPAFATRILADSSTLKPRLILGHCDDMLRVAGSLKLGWVTASLFIAKLQSFRRQNVLTRALQEYGRLNKTIFILRYLLDEPFQRRIGAQINKGEALHALRGFLFVANEGKIRRHYDEEQLNQVSCLQLSHQRRRALEYRLHERGVRSAEIRRL